MPSLYRNDKVTCANCRTESTRINLASHKKRQLVGTVYCRKCPNLSTRLQADPNFHIAKKLSLSQPKKLKFQFCHQVFAAFDHLRLHRQKVHNAHNASGTKQVDAAHLVGQIDDESLKEELETCKHFFVECEMENGQHRVFISAMEILDAYILSQKLDKVFEKLKCVAKLNAVFEFELNMQKMGLVGNTIHPKTTL